MAKSLGTELAAVALVEEITLKYPDWWVLFLAESDATLGNTPSVHVIGRHRVFRHYPGAGSLPFLVVIRDSKVLLLHSYTARGRACRIQFYQRSTSYKQTFVCMGDMGSSFRQVWPMLVHCAAVPGDMHHLSWLEIST